MEEKRTEMTEEERTARVKAVAQSMRVSLPGYMKPSLEVADVTRKRYEYEILKAKTEGKEPPKYMERLCAYSDEEIIGCFAAYFTVVDEALLKNDRYAHDFLDRCLGILCAFNPKLIDRLKERKSCLLDTVDDEFCSSLIQDGCPEVLAQSVSCLLHALYDLSGYASQLIRGLGGEPIAQMFMNISSEFIRNRAESMSAVLQEAWDINVGWEENLRDRIDYLEQRNLEASYAFTESMRDKDIIHAAEIDRLNEEHAKAMAVKNDTINKLSNENGELTEKNRSLAEENTKVVTENEERKKWYDMRYTELGEHLCSESYNYLEKIDVVKYHRPFRVKTFLGLFSALKEAAVDLSMEPPDPKEFLMNFCLSPRWKPITTKAYANIKYLESKRDEDDSDMDSKRW